MSRTPVAAIAGRTLGGIADGALAGLPVGFRFWDGSALPAPAADEPTIVVSDPSAIAHVLREPNQLGLARAWVTGGIEVDGDLDSVLALRDRFDGVAVTPAERARLALAAARAAGPALVRGAKVPAVEARRPGRLHSLARDRAVVTYHYDVSNEFYRLILGPSMVYSCAYFSSPGDTLEEAQERKLEVICRKLMLAPDERFLDVGCGWGSLLIHAARHHGVRGVGITLSEPQARLARERVDRAGLADRVEIRVVDYREFADEPFDKVASVGMYEHVGRDQLAAYTGAMRRLVRPGGLFLNHGIVRLEGRPRDMGRFISSYVFPDGFLHRITDVVEAMLGAGFEVRDVESLREHYALTLRRWVANLQADRAEAESHVGIERARVWHLYMLGAAQAFDVGEIGVYQVLGVREGASHALPLDRAALIGAPASATTPAGEPTTRAPGNGRSAPAAAR